MFGFKMFMSDMQDDHARVRLPMQHRSIVRRIEMRARSMACHYSIHYQ